MGKGLKVPAVFFKEKIRNFIPGIGVKICPGTDGRGDAAVPKGACTGHDLADTAFEGDHVITVVPEKLTVKTEIFPDIVVITVIEKGKILSRDFADDIGGNDMLIQGKADSLPVISGVYNMSVVRLKIHKHYLLYLPIP